VAKSFKYVTEFVKLLHSSSVKQLQQNMYIIFAFYFFIYVLFFKVHSLQCYRCVSQTSMEDCSSKDTKVTCPVSNAVCAKAEVKSESGGVSAQTFVKGTYRDNFHFSVSLRCKTATLFQCIPIREEGSLC